jgi:hypothetical protein
MGWLTSTIEKRCCKDLWLETAYISFFHLRIKVYFKKLELHQS